MRVSRKTNRNKVGKVGRTANHQVAEQTDRVVTHLVGQLVSLTLSQGQTDGLKKVAQAS